MESNGITRSIQNEEFKQQWIMDKTKEGCNGKQYSR